jgi:succinyl-diaminopimelate desuccinylase
MTRRDQAALAGPGAGPGRESSVRHQAEADHESVTSLVQALVRAPSRGGIDKYDDVVDIVTGWLDDRRLSCRRLYDDAAPGNLVGIVCDVTGIHPGPRYVLDACLDTAPFGDPAAWRHQPTSGVIEDGWLYGRGAADSKAAVAIFAHIAARLRRQIEQLRGSLTLLFDADEHTGRFGGAKRYFAGPDAPVDVTGVMIGYPGADYLVVGGRGLWRAELTVHGCAGHTGSRRSTHNAVEKAAQLVLSLGEHRTPAPTDDWLGLPPRLTVTHVHGGESYSIVPDRCVVGVDVRLTTTFDDVAAEGLICDIVARVDEQWPATSRTAVGYEETWPAFRLDEQSPVPSALTAAARRHLPNFIEAKVAGPSNIGNYLAKLGIDATAGLGVHYEGLHGTDERIDLSTIPSVQATYHDALLELLCDSTQVASK